MNLECCFFRQICSSFDWVRRSTGTARNRHIFYFSLNKSHPFIAICRCLLSSVGSFLWRMNVLIEKSPSICSTQLISLPSRCQCETSKRADQKSIWWTTLIDRRERKPLDGGVSSFTSNEEILQEQQRWHRDHQCFPANDEKKTWFPSSWSACILLCS